MKSWQLAIKYATGKVLIKEYASLQTASAAGEKYIRQNGVVSATPSPIYQGFNTI